MNGTRPQRVADPRSGTTLAYGVLLILALIAGAGACNKGQPRRFYTLTYPMPTRGRVASHPVTLRVKDLEISPTYRNTPVVFRRDQHEIQFDRQRRWTERPQRMISDLVRKHLRHAGLAAQVTDRLGEKAPDYVLDGGVEAIEELHAGDDSYAHLALRLHLVRFGDDAVVWRYSFDRRAQVPAGEGRAIVRAMSRLLEEELDRVVGSLDAYLAAVEAGVPPPAVQDTLPMSADATSGAGPLDEEGPPRPDLVRPDPDAILRSPALLGDTTPLPPGRGALFLEALADTDREPPLAVYQGNVRVAEGRMGRMVVLPPGEYEVRYGSGTVEQQLTTEVAIEEGRVTAIPPRWAVLEVHVVNEQSIGFRGSYELIYIPTREEFGIGFGADEERGESPRAWVLEPGPYKVVRAGGNYHDRTNFATVEIEAGQLTRFALVQDQNTEDFRGAGVIEEDLQRADPDDAWTFKMTLGGDFQLENIDLPEGQQVEGWDLDVGVFVESLARYERGRHQFVTRLDMEESQERAADQDDFSNKTDRLYLHTIYTYHLVPWFGPYARAGLESKLLPRYAHYDEKLDVHVLDGDGEREVDTFQSVDRVRLGTVLDPVELQQGAGGNFRVLHTLAVDLDLRLGLGAREYLRREEYVVDDRPGGRYVRETASYARVGPEVGLGGVARISRWIALSTDLSAFYSPYGDDPDVQFKSRSQASLRLVRFASLNYRINILRDPWRKAGEDTLWEHFVQLRFSWAPF